MPTAEGLLSTALTNERFSYAIGAPKNFGSRQSRIQRKKSFLFPELQETKDATVVFEFMKIKLSNLRMPRGRANWVRVLGMCF